MATPKRDNDLAARALVDALFLGDATACRNHKVSLRTLQRYRQALEEDAELAGLVTELTRTVQTQGWLKRLEGTMDAILQKIELGLEVVTSDGLGDVGRLVTILEALAEIKLSRDMYGVDQTDEGSETSRTRARMAESAEGQSAAGGFGPS